jgi:hypothetical protein
MMTTMFLLSPSLGTAQRASVLSLTANSTAQDLVDRELGAGRVVWDFQEISDMSPDSRRSGSETSLRVHGTGPVCK